VGVWGWGGLTLQIVGTLLAGDALLGDWRQHAQGRPLVPVVTRGVRWVRRRFGRSRPVTITGVTAMAVALAGAGTLTATVAPPEGALLEEHVAFLQSRMDELSKEIAAARILARTIEQGARSDMDKAETELRGEVAKLHETVVEVATGSVRQELLGLVLVGIGSILSAIV
jgi:hypothetical protein